MDTQSSDPKKYILHTITQIIRACDLIIKWNTSIQTSNQYLYSDDNLEKMAATCMMLESIGESVKRIWKLQPDFLPTLDNQIPWKNVMGMRDRIAHGYFQLDEYIIFDTVKNEVPIWKAIFEKSLEENKEENGG